jgi:soluble cytochrome b562
MLSARLRLGVSALAVILLLGAVALRAQQAPKPQPAPAPAPGQTTPAHAPPKAGAAEASLRDVMNGLKNNIKTLSTACAGKAREPALAAVAEMERLVLVGKGFEPQNQADTPEADRPQHLVDFRKDMLHLLKELADLEGDLLDGNFDAASKRIDTALPDLRDEAHDKYKKKRGPGR